MDQYLDIEEKKEIAVMAYEKSYDLEIAFITANMTAAEKEMLQRDESFMSRITYVDAKLKEEIITTMTSNMRSEDQKLAQKAAVDLGKIAWPEKFSGKAEPPKTQVPDSIILEGA